MAKLDRENTPLKRDWLVDRILAPLVPQEWRESFIGDLVEEARRFILPAHGPDAARRWLRWQIVRSLPGLLHHRRARASRLSDRRRYFVVLLVAFWILQAWDSRVHHATPFVIGLVVAAFTVAACNSLLGRRSASWLVMILAAPLLLIAARFLSPTIHSDLLAVIPAMTLFPLWLGGWLPTRQGTARCI